MTHPTPDGRLHIISAALIFLASLSAIVTLVVTGHPEGVEDVMILAGPVVGALFVTGRMDSRLVAQNDMLTKISAQTNGVLDTRIAEGVRASLEAYAPGVYVGKHADAEGAGYRTT